MKVLKRIFAAALSAHLLTGCLGTESTDLKDIKSKLNEQTIEQTDLSAAYMMFYDWGALNLNALLEGKVLPIKATMTGLWLSEGKIDLKKSLQKYGFITPRSVAHWPAHVAQPQFEYPMGFSRGNIRAKAPVVGQQNIEVMDISCAVCHGGHTFDAKGQPLIDNVFIGAPNSSINLEGFSRSAFGGLKKISTDVETFVGTIKQLYPDLAADEEHSFRTNFKALQKKVLEIAKYSPSGLGFQNGGPGYTNGLASMLIELGLVKPKTYHSQIRGFVSIPDLSDRQFRSSLLVDGGYTLKGDTGFEPRSQTQATLPHLKNLASIYTYFTVPTMRIPVDAVAKQIPVGEKIANYLYTYRAPQFPGEVRVQQAFKGEKIYLNSCTQCHGRYEKLTPEHFMDSKNETSELVRSARLTWFPNRLSVLAEIQTDGDRVTYTTEAMVDAVKKKSIARYLTPRNTFGYIGTILTGVWMTPPYLHNASVPSLAALLGITQRPVKFLVGGHRLNYTMMGFDLVPPQSANGVWTYPNDYQPWSTPEVYDTTAPGRSNKGHEAQFKVLTTEQKLDVLEYMKCL